MTTHRTSTVAAAIDAAERGDLAALRAMAPATLNGARGDGATPFYIACLNGHARVVRFLAEEARVDTQKANHNGWTPFNAACYYGHVEVARYLAEHAHADTRKASKSLKLMRMLQPTPPNRRRRVSDSTARALGAIRWDSRWCSVA